MFTKTLFAVAAWGLLTDAHMVINTPVPYGQDSLNNSPLAADGSDFPCKQRSGVYDITKMNNIAVGSPQTLAFTGGATHGGGSCQLSVTMDKQPTKQSSWKVIYSIEGGCPSNDTGNASEDANYKGSSVFSWQMPKGMPNGQYTLAWTWFNKIGNREMYMNCAPITVTGGANNDKVLDTLPDMFQANIGDGCTTVESEDLVFPDPGKYVETDGTALGTSLVGACTAGKAAGGGSGASPTGYGSGSGSGSSPASSSAAATTGYGAGATPGSGSGSGGAASSSAASPATTGGAGAGGPGAGSGSGMATSVNVETVTTMATVTAKGPASTGYGGSSSASPGGSGSGSGSGSSGSAGSGSAASSAGCAGTPCSTEGQVMCMDGGKWGLCNNGCAIARTLASGTSCNAGIIARRGRHLARIKRQLASHHH